MLVLLTIITCMCFVISFLAFIDDEPDVGGGFTIAGIFFVGLGYWAESLEEAKQVATILEVF